MRRALSFWIIICPLLMALFLAVRLPNLRALPVFCDEATYLRWAQLIHADPLRNLWISMNDAKLPLHYWLLALVYDINADPIYAGRLLSVALSALTIPLLLALATELEQIAAIRTGRTPQLTPFGLLAVFFTTLSPAMANFQRMALAEPLLLLETLALAWWSLRFARSVAQNTRTGRLALVRQSIAMGLIWAALLLTKQNFSYLLWSLPLLALALYANHATWRTIARQAFPPYLTATLIGLLIYIPVLFANTTYPIAVRLFYKPSFFEAPAFSRWEMLRTNLYWLFVPRVDGHLAWWPHSLSTPLTDGALYLYLTPPVYILLIAGIFGCIRKRSRVPLLFLTGWCAVLLLPLLFNRNFLTVRFTFLATAPMILAAAWVAAECINALSPHPTITTRVMQILITTICLAWPAAATIAQAIDCHAPTRLSADRREYLYGPSGGDSIQQASQWLEEQSHSQPITVITGNGPGEADYLWLTLRNNPRIILYWTNRTVIEPSPTTVPLGTEEWVGEPTQAVTLPARPIFRIQPLAPNPQGYPRVTPEHLGPLERVAKIVYNPPPQNGSAPIAGLAIIRLDAPIDH
jgi:hypothetical protein